MRFTIFILLQVVTIQLFAQTISNEFGEFSEEDINMTSYDKKPDAKAVVLYDKGNSVFLQSGYDFTIKFTKHKRIKIFDNAVADVAEIILPYYAPEGSEIGEKYGLIEAATWNNVNGKMVRKSVYPLKIYDEKVNNFYRQKKFVFPDVQDGAILEYRYTLVTPYKENLKDWHFQSTIPTIYSEYSVMVIPLFEYTYLLKGASKFDYMAVDTSQNGTEFKSRPSYPSGRSIFGDLRNSTTTNQNPNDKDSKSKLPKNEIIYLPVIYTYVMKDVEAFKSKDFVASIDDYLIKLDFQLSRSETPDWNRINLYIAKHEDFNRYLDECHKYAVKVLDKELDITGLDKKQISEKVISFVKKNFQWNEKESVFASQEANEFYKNRVGNNADINLFLIALLKEAGIDASAVVSSTRDNGKIVITHPTFQSINYLLVLVNTRTPFLADATDKLLPTNRLPIRCLNEKGLVLKSFWEASIIDSEDNWVLLNNSATAHSKNMINITLDSSTLDLKTKVSIIQREYEAYTTRKNYRDDKEDLKEYYKDYVGDISLLVTRGYDKLDGVYSINMKSDFETEFIGENILVKPFLNIPIDYEVLKEDTRKYPVDFTYSWNDEFQSIINVPAGYTVPSLPEPLNIDNESVSINLTYSYENNKLTAIGQYAFKKAIYQPSEYASLKGYFETIVDKFNAPIVLEKNDVKLTGKSK